MIEKSIFDKIKDGTYYMSEFSKENIDFITALMKFAYLEGECQAESLWIEGNNYSKSDIKRMILIEKAYNLLVNKLK